MNRMNKLHWIKLGCFGRDMWIAFTHLLPQAAVSGSLPASYCEWHKFNHELSNFLVYNTLIFMYNLDRKEILECIAYLWKNNI